MDERIGRTDTAPIFAIVCIFYAIYTGVPMFVLTHYSRAWFLAERTPDSAMEFALGLSLAGVGCMLIGFYNPLSSAIASVSPRIRFVWGDSRSVSRAATSLVFLGVSVMLLGYKYMRFEGTEAVPAGIQQFFYFAMQTAYIGAGMLYCQWERGQLRRGYSLSLWFVIVPAIAAIGVSTGALAPALDLAGCGKPPCGLKVSEHSIINAVITYTCTSGNRPKIVFPQPARALAGFNSQCSTKAGSWALFLGGLSVFVLLNPMKTAFRQSIGANKSSASASPVARLVLMGDLI